MARSFQDDDLITWEAFASSGRFGYARNAHLVFNCLSDLSRRALVIQRTGDRAEVEREVLNMPEEKLRELLQQAQSN